jgi:hypothetical protein
MVPTAIVPMRFPFQQRKRWEAGQEETRHLRLSRLDAHLRTQPERKVHSACADDAQAAPQEPHGGRRMVPGAPTCTGGRAAEDPQRQAPRPLPVLRPPDKLSEPSEVLSGRRKDLAEVAQSSHARKPDDVGAIHRASTTLSVAATSDSPCLDVTGESCLRNPLREICTVGSVRDEISRWCHGGPKRARSWKRRTQPRKTYSLPGLLYSERWRFFIS